LQKLSDEDFLKLISEIGPEALSKRIGSSVRVVYARRKKLEGKLGREVKVFDSRKFRKHPARHQIKVKNGIVLVGSDAHYWPKRITMAHKVMVHLVKTLKPVAVVMNGDVFDGSAISRFPPIGWEQRPSVADEIEAAQNRLGEIEKAAKGAQLIWPLGNHDGRFETRLATVAPEYARVFGVHLRDHFPKWTPCWSCWINDDVVIKHRYKGGLHATHNNTLYAGKTTVTGHDHMLKVTPFIDYNGIRWGCSSGTLAEPEGDQFTDYTEDNPKNWASGLLALTFMDGVLSWPEPVFVDGRAGVYHFRGEQVKL